MLVSPSLRRRSDCESYGVMAVTGTGGMVKKVSHRTKGTDIPGDLT